MIKIIPDRDGFITQWDLNRKVLISGLDNLDKAGIEVHFASPNDDHNAYVVSPVINNNIVSAAIPNILLTIPGRIYVYVYTSYTQDKAIVAVAPREKPDDYVYTETEKFALEQWEKEVTEKLEGRYDKAVQEIDERYAGLRDDAITASAAAASAQTSAAAADLSATRAESAETNAKENAKSDVLAAKSAAEAAKEKAASSANAAKESQTAAETAESNATEAAKAALQEATSATEAKDNAITAKDDAENAKDIAETAKDDAIAAKNAAEQAKTAAETAAENVPIIDDTLAAGNRTWSSQNIIEKLCPPLIGSGNPVVVSDCIEGYPMKITASWEPTQAGSGAPSPENIRAISGKTSVTVTGCGENLLNIRNALIYQKAYGINISREEDAIRLCGTASVTSESASFGVMAVDTKMLSGKKLNITAYPIRGTLKKAYGLRTSEEVSIAVMLDLVAGQEYDILTQIMVSKEASSAYAPYTGTTRNLTLSETVYGGSVDAATGEGMMTWSLITLDGTEDGWYKYGGVDTDAKTSCFTIGISDKAYGFGSSICNLFCNTNDDSSYTSNRMKAYNYTDHPNLPNVYMNFGVDRTVTADDWKSYLAAQYAAGTPVQIAYKLAEPVPFTATGGSLLYQLDGINTVISDADTLTANGRADPIKVMESQRQAIISLGGNI